MPRFDESSNNSYVNVNAVADQQGLIWDGRLGSPYGIQEMIAKDLRVQELTLQESALFDHTVRFKPTGSGSSKPVLAITSPYPNWVLRQTAADVVRLAQEFAERFQLGVRANDDRDRVYRAPEAIPILFWRPDLHELQT